MALELDFDICISECCDKLQFCDNTCVFDPNAPVNCQDGYGSIGNPTLSQIGSTLFNWILPDGTTFNSVNPLFLQGLSASYSLQITGGTGGNVGVAINSTYIGTTFYITDLATTANNLVTSINSLGQGTGWYAYIDTTDVTLTTVIIYNVNVGTAYNNMSILVDTDVTMTTSWVVTDLTANGRDGSNCYDVELTDLYSATQNPCQLTNYPNFSDGVYTITYIVFNTDGLEINRKTKKFFIDCNAKKCLKTLIKTLLDDSCGCSDPDPRIVMLRSKLDAARNQFDECLYKCAQETIESVNKQCINFCLDCD